MADHGSKFCKHLEAKLIPVRGRRGGWRFPYLGLFRVRRFLSNCHYLDDMRAVSVTKFGPLASRRMASKTRQYTPIHAVDTNVVYRRSSRSLRSMILCPNPLIRASSRKKKILLLSKTLHIRFLGFVRAKKFPHFSRVTSRTCTSPAPCAY